MSLVKTIRDTDLEINIEGLLYLKHSPWVWRLFGKVVT